MFSNKLKGLKGQELVKAANDVIRQGGYSPEFRRFETGRVGELFTALVTGDPAFGQTNYILSDEQAAELMN